LQAYIIELRHDFLSDKTLLTECSLNDKAAGLPAALLFFKPITGYTCHESGGIYVLKRRARTMDENSLPHVK
jgi:hypothetical protein